MTVEQITAFFGKHVEAIARRDAVALAAGYAEDAVLHSPTAGTVTGRRDIERVFRLWFSAFPDLKWEIDDLVIGRDRAASLNTFSGTDLGGFLGLAPTGRVMRVHGAFLYTFRNDLIAHERRVLDFSGVLLQLAGEVGPMTDSFRKYRQMLARARSEQELRIAADIQRALLPRTRFTSTRFDVAATSVPCRAIGGDFFDYFESREEMFAFVLGDVAGKGPPAALLTAVLQGIFVANADSGFSPAKTMGWSTPPFCAGQSSRVSPPFFTRWYRSMAV
jgi:predicted ester cyclase